MYRSIDEVDEVLSFRHMSLWLGINPVRHFIGYLGTY